MNSIERFLVSIDTKGKIRQVILEAHWDSEQHGFVLNRTTGLLGGQLTQQPAILVQKGKANRTVTEQIALQFNSKLKEYKDKGYKEIPNNPNTYAESELREIIGDVTTNQAGVLKPMLAKQADKVTNKKIFEKEWFASRKIDGVRCLMYFKDGAVHTASRGGENYDLSTTHITQHPSIVKFFQNNPDLILDGELYKHGKSLQQISGAARMKKNAYDMDWLEYYVYDIADITKSFKERLVILDSVKHTLNVNFEPNKEYSEGDLQVQIVPQVKVKGWENIKKLHDDYVTEGWEGVVIRDPDKVYRPDGRTNDMIKIKQYRDSEFKITGISEGLRDEDMCFTLITEDGIPFKAKPMGNREIKDQYRKDLNILIGKMATVKYFYLSDDGTPLQPVLKAIRDYE